MTIKSLQITCCAVLSAYCGAVCAAENPVPAKQPAVPDSTLGEIVVSGKRFSDTEERRYSTAAKTVFGREEIQRYGDSSVSEVLKRLPGITVSGTPGRGGDIRMRGLGKGYTMILINGEPVPRGFSLDDLPPEQVERIEVMRAPVAEHSARAIAGTINIVLKEEFAKKVNEAHASLGWEDGRFQPGVSLQRGGSDGNFSYNLSGNLMHKELPSVSTTATTATDTRSGAPTMAQTLREESQRISDGVHLNARLNWKLDGGDSFSFQPFMGQWRSTSRGDARLDQTVGAQPASYANAHWQSDSDSAWVRGMGNLKRKLSAGARLEARFNVGQYESDSQTARTEYDALGGLAHTIRNSTGLRDNSASFSGKYARPLAQAHQFAAGWELEAGSRRESASSIQDGVNPLARYGDNVQARTQRVAGFAQDEWDISPLWAVYGGLRWEGIRTLSESAVDSASNRSSVLSPLFHSIWRFTEESKDQVRLGLTRTYRAATLTNLTALPTLSANYPAAGANTATSPDSIGNPDLKPELAWGLDLAVEHYLPAGGLFSASLFRRDIDDLIRNVTSLQTVVWSPQQRWVSMPQNVGSATSHGIELEAKFRLDELVRDAPQLSVRANYSRYWSSVDGVPGPDNRLDQQPRQTANLGLDYRLRGLPLSVGGNFNWMPAYAVQQTEAQTYYQGVKRVFDIYALWKFDPNTQMRLSAANLLHDDYRTADREIHGSTDQLAETVRRTYLSLAARLEIKF
jgi:iron complex outermembrane receptor protein